MSDGTYDEKPKRSPRYNPDTSPCVICGGADYEWGHPGSQGGVYFLAGETWFGFGAGEPLRARKCLRCGNVQLFVR